MPQREAIGGFLGVNLRRDALTLEDSDLARAINVDLHTVTGVARLRQGRVQVGDTTLATASQGIRLATRLEGRRYQIANHDWYRNFTSIRGDLHSDFVNTLFAFRPLNDTTTWVFLADKNHMRCDNGSTERKWGITATIGVPVATLNATGSLTGTYSARYTYARVLSSGAIAHESNPSPASNAVALAADSLDVAVLASSDSQVTDIRVYRTVSGGAVHLFDRQVANTTATINLTKADSALGTQVETDNDVPPQCGWAVEFQGHIFLCRDDTNPHYLWYSKRFLPESFPAAQFLLVGNPSDPLQAAVSLTGMLGVFTRLTKYRIFGNSVSGFVPMEALSTRGTMAPQAILTLSRGAIFPARDGLFLTNFVEQDQELTADIQPLFNGITVHDNAPIDWDDVNRLSLAEYKRRLYFGYRGTDNVHRIAVYSQDTGKWFFYTHPVRSLYFEEATDQFHMGGTDGKLWHIENFPDDAGTSISLAMDLPTRFGKDRFVLKRFEYLRVDAEMRSGTLAAALYIDGTLRTTVNVTGNRTRTLHRLPPALLGQTWQAKLTYTGLEAIEIHAVEMQYTALGAS